MVTAESPDTCPTPTGHKRLNEVHRFWHECLEGYQDPEEFRIKLNACIQALRNSTFAIQKEKRLIEDFADWYSGWQDKMAADPVMKWLNNARITIVHSQDLEMESESHVRLMAGYGDATLAVLAGLAPTDSSASPQQGPDVEEVKAPPLLSLSDIIAKVQASGLPRRYIDQASLTIERRWVDKDLPEIELLDAISYGYAFVSRLIEDAHTRAGLAYEVTERHGDLIVRRSNDGALDGRLPCMVTTREERTLNMMMRDGQPVTGGRSHPLVYNEEHQRLAAKRYRVQERRLQRLPMNAIDLLPVWAERGRAIVKAGEQHTWMVFFFKGARLADGQAFVPENTADKRALSQQVAEHVARHRFDGVINVGEVWEAPMKIEDGFILPAAEHPDKTEALILHAHLATGESAALRVSIRRRRFSGPRVGEPEPFDVTDEFMRPTRAVWESWNQQTEEPAATK